ncbi:MAG: class I SAM-dependent methyltransferase [Phycisphaerales bacterium]
MTADTESPLDRFDLYERCVQSPADVVALILSAHGGAPRVLGEDFSGSAAVSREWTASHADRSAVACDLDPAAIMLAARHPRVTAILGDVTTDPQVATSRVDAIFVGNFSVGYLHTRAALIGYLQRTRTRLSPGGVFVMDTYGGVDAFRPGALERRFPIEDGREIRSTFERIRGDQATGMVHNALHFRVFKGAEVVAEFTSAFIYHWRLWSVPELADALDETGFDPPTLHWTIPVAPASGTAQPHHVAAQEPWPANWAIALSARPRAEACARTLSA